MHAALRKALCSGVAGLLVCGALVCWGAEPMCAGAPDSAKVPGQVTLYVARGEGVSSARVDWIVSQTTRQLERLGIASQFVVSPVPLSVRNLFVATVGDLLRSRPEGAQVVEAKEALGELADFVDRFSRPLGAGVHVVVLHEIAPRTTAVAAVVGDLLGLTLPGDETVLLSCGDGERGSLGLVGGYTPTVVLSAARLARVGEQAAGWTVVHEIGHVLGLTHDGRVWNLMSDARSDCSPGLSDAQVKHLRTGLRALATPR